MISRLTQVRILLNLFVGLSVLFFPWWVSLTFIILLVLLCEAWEVLLWGALFDVLYGSPVPLYANISLLFTLTTAFLFFAVNILK